MEDAALKGPGFFSSLRHGPIQKCTCIARPGFFSAQTSCFCSFQICESRGKLTVWVQGSDRPGSTSSALRPLGSGGMCAFLLHVVVNMTGLLAGVTALLPSPSGTSGSLGLQDAPETTAEAPSLPTNLHGAWPTTIVYPSPSPGLDLLSFTGQSTVSAALRDEGFLCFFVISGMGQNCRELCRSSSSL